MKLDRDPNGQGSAPALPVGAPALSVMPCEHGLRVRSMGDRPRCGFGKQSFRAVALVAAVTPPMTQAQDQASVPLAPSSMKRVGTIDDRYQSYNVEMLEVTGGRFWKPYKDIPEDRCPNGIRGQGRRHARRHES